MKIRCLNPLLFALLLLLIELPAHTCGPDWAEAVFVKRHGPDAPYKAFVRGRLGVPQPGYRTRHLIVIYRYLNGLPLAANEQGAAASANDRFNTNWDTDQQAPLLEHAGFQSWIESRKAFGPVDGFIPESPFATQRAWESDSYFENCLDDAFANAARTLAARRAAYGTSSADVLEWVRGQDAVFHTCENKGEAPPNAPLSAAQWLRYDRAYQQAAALLYQGRYEDAIAAFTAIAGDLRSPWSALSNYLVARVMVARAVALEGYYPPSGVDTSKVVPPEQRLADYLTQLRAAQTLLETMRGDARMQTYTHAMGALLDRVNARLQPALQERTLAVRLTSDAPDANFYQDALDLSYLLSDDPGGEDSALASRPKSAALPARNAAERRGMDMLAWIRAFHESDAQASLQHWTATPSPAWLLAALTFAKAEDAATPQLLHAAGAIDPTDSAYAAVAYHQLRLTPAGSSGRAGLLAVMSRLPPDEGTSTRNLFAELSARSAPDLQTWLVDAARKPAAEATYTEEEPFETKALPQPCGPKLLAADTRLFAADAATVFNTRLPLRILVLAAESTKLPANLRFQVAQAAWTRAVLLNRRAVAAKLSPILIRCNASWQPVLEAYDHANSTNDRRAAALFALMRFASTEPNVREGNYRNDGFAVYSYYRDNWWCATIPPTQHTGAGITPQYDADMGWGFTAPAHPEVPDPAFLTPADHAEAVAEITSLRAIAKASEYLPAQVLTWQREHPHDARTPELLGQAFRVVRNACAGKSSTETEHQLFLVLQREYPTNHWSRRYRSWQ